MTKHHNAFGDCLDRMKEIPDGYCDLVICSPPYEDARTYGIGIDLKGQDWVDWCMPRYLECCRVCKGLVAWVVEGRTRKFQWTATPALLMADLHRAGVMLRKPPIYKRNGIPGSGGPDFWRNDYEFIVCASKGRLPWSDNTATGHPPKYGPGGEPSHRLPDGTRINAKLQTRRKPNGCRARDGLYKPPVLANPGNIIDCGAVGGGNIGSKLAHENEAPFPEQLVEAYVKSFCPPGGWVLDPFGGSGTTSAVAKRLGRNSISIDIRKSQQELTARRLAEVV